MGVVQGLRENVFKEAGLPTLHLKDKIRTVDLKLRNFETIRGEE